MLLRLLLPLGLMALLASCGPGGDNTMATSTPMTGVVKVPAGVQLAKPTLLSRAGEFLSSTAWALSGMEAVGGNVEVRLYAIDLTGVQVGPTLASTTTDGNGRYRITVPSRDTYQPHTPWVLAVGSAANGTLMRRLIDDVVAVSTDRDVDPASEATVRLLLQDNDPLDWTRVSRTEMADLNNLVATAAKSASGSSINNVADLALEFARDYEPLQRALAAATSTETNARPVALAGVDRRLVTQTLVNVRGVGIDSDSPNLSYQWTVDAIPSGSNVNRTPPNGPEFAFQPDVDGVYRLKLVIDDGIQLSPPDYALYIATTPAIPLTINNNAQSEGRLNAGRSRLVYTNTVRDAKNNHNYTDVEIQSTSALGPTGPPLVMFPPGATLLDHVFKTSEINPYISADGAMVVYATDMDPANPGFGGSDFEIVAYDYNFNNAMWLTNNSALERQPVVECPSPSLCVVVFLRDATAAGTHLISRILNNPGTGFVLGPELQLTIGVGNRFSPRLTADGAWVYYQDRGSTSPADPYDGDLEVFRIRTDGSMAGIPEQITINDVQDDQLAIDLTGDNLVVRRLSEVWWITPATSTEVLISGSQLIAYTPSLAGNGTAAAFVADTTEGKDLFVASPDGFTRTRLTADGTISYPQMSDTGLHVMFRSDVDGDHDYYLLLR
ncbi:MAG: hypothetical protein OEY97_01745 [Nitrospirota bacterium]|nr:hypothetical protein [Nitrospirota bacterium]